MDQSKATLLVIAFLSLLAVFVIVASILILSGGKVYHKIPEKSRPRRWFVAIFFSYFVTFCGWFPVWFFYPRSIISHVLSFIFGAFTAFHRSLVCSWESGGHPFASYCSGRTDSGRLQRQKRRKKTLRGTVFVRAKSRYRTSLTMSALSNSF
jgi:hypothetical protein